MAFISTELLDEEWTKYKKIQSLLLTNEEIFGEFMLEKYMFEKDSVIHGMPDKEVYKYIQSNYIKDNSSYKDLIRKT